MQHITWKSLKRLQAFQPLIPKSIRGGSVKSAYNSGPAIVSHNDKRARGVLFVSGGRQIHILLYKVLINL